MRRHTRRTLGALAILAPVLMASAVATRDLALQPESRLWFEGTSTVRSWDCKADAFDAVVRTTQEAPVRAVLAGQKAVADVELTVPAAELDCSNGAMNDHMHKALKVEEHPTIIFRVRSYELERTGGGVQTTLRGELTLAGVTKPITVAAVAADGGDGTLTVTGSHRLNMKEFGIKPPTLMFGTLRVGETVDVKFDLRLGSR